MPDMLHRPLDRLIACSACGCHAKTNESECPHCGASLRRRDGVVPRTAAAVLMGLGAAALLTACSDSDTGGSSGGGYAAAYGVALTDDDGDGYYYPGDDCDDKNKDIHPGATETPGDMIDSNCNGDDNM